MHSIEIDLLGNSAGRIYRTSATTGLRQRLTGARYLRTALIVSSSSALTGSYSQGHSIE